MIINSSAADIRTKIAKYLIGFALDNTSGEEAALDIVEVIALRMPSATDEEIAIVGFFVRAHLVAMSRQAVSYCEVLHQLSEAAIIAGLGPAALRENLIAGLDALLR